MTAFHGIVLAAGAGRRFGPAVKQLAPLGGRPLLGWALEAASGARGLDRVSVVLGAHADEVRAAVDLGRAAVVACPGWEEGLAASLRAGVDAAAGADWMVVTLGDAPLVRASAIDAVVAAARDAAPEVAAVRARWGGRPGHPVALRAVLCDRLLALRGDAGARAVLAEVTVLEVDCDGHGDPADADTPAALAAIAARLG
jgi:CTP:molybdopterin cytidylyltransferase MocA